MPDGALCRYLSEADSAGPVAREIELALGVNEKFKATPNVVLKLIDVLQADGLGDAPFPDKRAAWLQTLVKVRDAGEAQSWPVAAPTGRNGNPAGGQIGDYPLASYVIQGTDSVIKRQAAGTFLIFLMALMESDPRTRSLDDVATTLRLAVIPRSGLVPFLNTLPEFHSYQEYCVALQEALNTADSAGLPSNAKKFVKTVLGLLSQTKQNPRRRAPPAWNGYTPSIPSVDTLDEAPFAGGIGMLTLDRDGGDQGESPQRELLYVAPEAEPANSEEMAQAIAEADADAIESRHWISRHQRLVPTATVRFTRAERRRVASFIRAGLASDDRSESTTCALLALMYLTGRDLDDVLDATIGHDGEIAPGSIYVRAIKPPTDGYKAPEHDASFLAPSAEKIELQLPEPLGSWLARYTNGPAMPLIERLCIIRDDAKDRVADALERLRDSGRFYRIRAERIPAALAIEVTLAYQDPVTTFFLTGKPNHAAPMLGYYVVLPVRRLIDAYAQVAMRMLET